MKSKVKINVKLLVTAALLLALAMLLPQLFGRIQALGSKFLPMHIPVILCGFICGIRYGGICGLCAPLLCSAFFGMPPLFPMAVSMAVELCFYGISAGVVRWLFNKYNPKIKIAFLYAGLVFVMLVGRIAYGVTMLLIMSLQGKGYAFEVFLSASVLSAIPGIAVQLVLIPVILMALSKAGVIKERYI